MGVLAKLNDEGDRRVPWDPTNPAQVEEARTKFHEYIRSGYRAFKMGRRGQPGDRISEFDPNAGEILFIPQHAGG